MTESIKKDPWDLPEERQYIMYNENNEVCVTFSDFEPQVFVNQFGTTQWNFLVYDNFDNNVCKTYSVTSIRLMRKLQSERPLAGKSLKICRVGNGLDTDYTVHH